MSVSALARPMAPRRVLAWYRRQGSTYGWVLLFLLPFVALFGVFTLYPIVATIVFSFFHLTTTGRVADFVGFGQYQKLFADPIFWKAFFNTIFFVVANCAIKLPLSFLLAYLLTRPWLRLKSLFRTVFFLPVVVNIALVGIVFQGLLQPTGPLGSIFSRLNLGGSQGLLGNTATAMWVVIVVSVWQIFGQYVIYWMAALQNVPEDLYEAADVDGAGFWQKIRHVTLPTIRPIAITITLLGAADAVRVFAIVFTMTPGSGGGGPDNSTNVLSTYVFQNAFGVNGAIDYGFAAAIASVFLALAVVLSGAYALASRRGRTAGLFVTGKGA